MLNVTFSMDRNAIKQHIENTACRVDLVLRRYSSNRGCPCNIKQFVYWAGKQQGPGWQDNIQNQLVESTLKLVCFEQIEDLEKSYGLEGSYVCNNCGTEWNLFSIEWRMLAFHKRLLKIGADDPGKLYEELIGNDVFATVGHEPDGRNTLSLEQWVSFMLGMDHKAEPYHTFFPVIKRKTGFWHRILSGLKRNK